jgi:FtsZ-binding cell division protein ZapB
MRYTSARRRARTPAAGGRVPLLTAAALLLVSATGLLALAGAPADENAADASPPAEAAAETRDAAAEDAGSDEAKPDDAGDANTGSEADRANADDAGGTKAAAPPAERGPQVEDTREALKKWVETRRLIAEEKRDWALGKEMLNERIELVKREIESLRKKIAEAEKSIGEAEKKRADLTEKNDALKAASAELKDTVIALEGRTKELLQRLPESIQGDVRQLSQQFPEDPQESKLSLGIRFQNVVGVLNHLNKRNRDITVTSEVRDLPGGASAEVTTMYVGVSQAYYVSGDGSLAGVGTATPDGWVWTPVNEAAPRIAEAIAILKNEKVASFVRLPVEVH